MNHYMDFDPYVIGERYQQVHRGVHALRLKERLREERGSSGSRLGALARRDVRPLLGEVHRAGSRWLRSVQGSRTPRRTREVASKRRNAS